MKNFIFKLKKIFGKIFLLKFKFFSNSLKDLEIFSFLNSQVIKQLSSIKHT